MNSILFSYFNSIYCLWSLPSKVNALHIVSVEFNGFILNNWNKSFFPFPWILFHSMIRIFSISPFPFSLSVSLPLSLSRLCNLASAAVSFHLLLFCLPWIVFVVCFVYQFLHYRAYVCHSDLHLLHSLKPIQPLLCVINFESRPIQNHFSMHFSRVI